MKKLLSMILVVLIMSASCFVFAPNASAKTTPWYKISDINNNKVTSRTDYYDIKGNKTIKFEFAYVNSGCVFPNLFKSAYDDEAYIVKSKVRFDYKIYRNGKIIKSGSGLDYNDTIKISGNFAKTCRVYITSYFTANGKTLYNRGNILYAKGVGAEAVRYCKYRINY